MSYTDQLLEAAHHPAPYSDWTDDSVTLAAIEDHGRRLVHVLDGHIARLNFLAAAQTIDRVDSLVTAALVVQSRLALRKPEVPA